MDNPAADAAAAAREAERRNRDIPNVVRSGQPIGECECGVRFHYGRGGQVEIMASCPECGANDWWKWGYRHNGEMIRRDDAWDKYDAPPSAKDGDGRE